MYKVSFHGLFDPEACFVEIIGALQRVLNWSDERAHTLHRKATDLYWRIAELATLRKVQYGKADDRQGIESWMAKHPTHVEKKEISSEYNLIRCKI
jgi:hypothetical protein